MDTQGPMDAPAPLEPLPYTPLPEPRKWYEIWWDVWRHPGANTFRAILQEPNATLSRAFIWVGVAGLIAGLISALSSLISPLESETVSPYLYIGCTTILIPIMAVIGLAISGGIYHLVARLFGGTGSWDKLAYCFATVTAPASIVSTIVSMFTVSTATVLQTLISGQGSNLPSSASALTTPLTCVAGLIAFALGIYQIILMVHAIDGTENIGTGNAVLTYFIPVVVVIVLTVCCAVIGLVPWIANTSS